MTKDVSEIKSSLITQIVCYLCKKAAIILPKDVYEEINNIYQKETSETARGFIKEIIVNANIAASSSRPVCQDTGVTVVFVEIGQKVIIKGDFLETAVNKGVEKAYKDFFLRKSIVKDAVFERINTETNTPAVIHTFMVPGDSIKISVMLKGSGSENMSAVKMLKPYDGVEGIVNFITETVKKAGPNSCPPLQIGVGIGGTMEKAAILAKKALVKKITAISELENAAQKDFKKELELKILNEVQKTGVGAEGFGGNCTAFAVNVETSSCHMASLPVAVNLNCHAARSASMVIDKNTVAPDVIKPDFQINKINIDYSLYKKIKLPLKEEDIKSLKAGDRALLTGEIYTARDAAHKKIFESIQTGKSLPFEIEKSVIYYAGPCPAAANEAIGPAGPTTSCRMDVYTPKLLDMGVSATIGKGSRSKDVIESMKKNKAIYMVATGGVACLISEKIKSAEIVAYPELGAEAVYKLKVEGFPVIVAIDINGTDFYKKNEN